MPSSTSAKARLFLTLILLLVPAIFLTAAPSRADLAASKAIVEAAKARGEVGEQGDGYLGFVTSSNNPQVASAVAEINAGRAAVYQDAASKTGVSAPAAGEAAAQKLFNMVPPGQYYKPLNGTWARK